MSERSVIRLADLAASPGSVILPDGRKVEVRPIDGIGMQLIQALQTGREPMVLWDIVARCLGMAREDVMGINMPQANAIIELASGRAQGVMQELGEDTGALAEAKATGAPPTASATSSSA